MKEKVQVALIRCGFYPEQIRLVFPYGSHVYGTTTKESDHDFIVVADHKGYHFETQEKNINITTYGSVEFVQKALQHEISVLECLSLPPEKLVIADYDYRMLAINHAALRKAISAKASNSFVKCKKKLQVEREYNIGKKSLFHCLRIIKFGIQLAIHGRIVDYTVANNFHQDIVLNECNDWDFYKEKYKPVYNALMSEFRKVAPKE